LLDPRLIDPGSALIHVGGSYAGSYAAMLIKTLLVVEQMPLRVVCSNVEQMISDQRNL